MASMSASTSQRTSEVERSGLSLQAQQSHVAGEGVCESLALADHGEQGPAPLIDQRGLREQPRIDAIKQKLGLDREIDDSELLRRGCRFAPDIANEFLTPFPKHAAKLVATAGERIPRVFERFPQRIEPVL